MSSPSSDPERLSRLPTPNSTMRYSGSLEELRDAIWFCFVRDRLETCFGQECGYCATNLVDYFDKARTE
jgi:hypothetical protein